MGMWDVWIVGGHVDATLFKGSADNKADAVALAERMLRSLAGARQAGGAERSGPDCFAFSLAEMFTMTRDERLS